jgi:4-hydroxybenzoate polyprenyltransferase
VKIRAWLQLIRLPNLLTVPGDPLAGACLTLALEGSDRLAPAWPAALVSLWLYTSGLLLNDCCDLKEDRRQRPDRPLPSGAVPFAHAAMAAVLLAVAALALAYAIRPATGATAGALAVMILLYNLLLKEIPLLGALAMGSCRGLSLLLGATAVGAPALPKGALPGAALILTLYVAAVTAIAAREHQAVTLGFKRWFPLLALLALPAFLLPVAHGWTRLALLPALVAVGLIAHLARHLDGTPAPGKVQASIGRYIRLLLLVQAALCFVQFPAGSVIGVALILLWPVSRRLGRWFYGS